MPTTSDPNALLATLYRENHRWLRGWLSRRLQCPQDAADLTQDTFLRALNSRQLEQIQEPRAFLGTLAKRLLCNLWRRRQLERSYLDALAQLPERFAPSEEDIALVREAIEAIDRLLDGLPLRARRAFLLNRLDGLGQQAIAERLGVSLATVERDLRRAYIHCLTRDPEQP
ncbi:sigma factor, FecI family [Azotobacter vinelandii CA]|uniref:Sigma factor, FecI family n=2 Tax=Azotobacter vinelandii TaxID=354 RepID=C1DDL3_AZOVD|nr:sigma-70 family RNA polymerase sigma factor [Azotobacter vinelandii]ACO77984.1 sigma factor, FecI family [Azotobacter vinelandii DJ]AGK16905.1 sigma factor, FecI family [Azotobacter vinelandii CA]AGK20145.1 sigma factor, FecI family [Azotobacter vinelandii CA6]WKN23711.1 sigma-70 family RNA polymerase sigma factor [Azotobacter vinelandii]SFX91985.1 RNA polymerase sigma-70 factor, ECF subfamily [Azotobacter vinelandii]